MNLYKIEEELLRIFATIEENDGEVTEEMFAELNINKENLNSKLNNYVKAIRNWESDTEAVKKEVDRLNANAKVKKNRIERLKKAMLQAVQLFGNDGKTNKFIDLPTVKLFTKATPAVVTDESRIKRLVEEFERFTRELVDNGVLYTGQDVDLQGVLASINANLKAEHEQHNVEVYGMDITKPYVPYVISDLTTLKIEITTTQTIYDLFRTGKDALELYAKNHINTSMRDHTAKADWKGAIEVIDIINVSATSAEEMANYPTVASIVKNDSIQIK